MKISFTEEVEKLRFDVAYMTEGNSTLYHLYKFTAVPQKAAAPPACTLSNRDNENTFVFPQDSKITVIRSVCFEEDPSEQAIVREQTTTKTKLFLLLLLFISIFVYLNSGD